MVSKRIKILTGVAASLLLPLYFFIDPEKWRIFPQCPFLVLTGLYCPGCGSQRAIHDLLHLRIASSLDHNLLVVPALVLLLIHAWQLIRKEQLEQAGKKLLFHKTITPVLMGILFLIFGVLRNIPLQAFEYIRP